MYIVDKSVKPYQRSKSCINCQYLTTNILKFGFVETVYSFKNLVLTHVLNLFNFNFPKLEYTLSFGNATGLVLNKQTLTCYISLNKISCNGKNDW